MSGLLPLIQRELRMAARHGPPIRHHWKTMGGVVLVAVLLLLIFRVGPGFGLVQTGLGLISYCMARGPMLFASDQEAGSQSLLRLAGLGPVQVFWGSLLGSLLLILEGALIMTPVLLIGLWWCGARPMGVVLLTLLPVILLVFGAANQAVGRLCARSTSGAAAIALGLVALVSLLPLILEWWIGPRLGLTGRRVLYAWGGLRDWISIRGTCVGHDLGTGVGRLLLRLLAWTVVLSGLATWLFHRQWYKADQTGGILRRWREAWGGTAAWRRSQLPVPLGSVYSWRLRRNRSWAHGLVLVVAVLGLVGVSVAAFLPWPALVATAMGYVAAVDVLLHLAVSLPIAEDRREGGFELLLTTVLEPAEIFAEMNSEVQRLRRMADRSGAVLLGALAILGGGKLLAAGTALAQEWLGFALVWCWPLAYAVSLRRLTFDRPIAQAINTAAVLHNDNPPKTPGLLFLASGVGLWFMADGTYLPPLAIAVLGLIVVVGWLAIRENTAADRNFAYDALRTVATWPLRGEPANATPPPPEAKSPSTTDSVP